jgi:two-component system sensor histidine kinase AlgZ
MRQRTRLFWALQIGGWGLYGVAMMLALLPYMKLREILIFRGVFTGLCFAASLLLHPLCRSLWKRKSGFLSIAAIVLPYCLAGGYLSAVAAIYTESILFPMQWTERRVSLWLASLNGGVNAAMVLVAWAALYFGFKHYEQIEAERRRVLQMEASARDAQLRALRYQVQPHFLFNTLNAISTLVVEGNSQGATTMISRLADFFRATLDEDEHQTTLEQEIHLTEQYLAIEKTRLGERLTVEIDVANTALDVPVPRMLLQPLAENAIRHSIAPRPSGGTLRIAVHRENDRVRITMSDTGNGDRPKRGFDKWRSGVGLANTEQRLKQTYGADYLFHVQPSNLGGWEIVFDLPAEPQSLSAGAAG